MSEQQEVERKKKQANVVLALVLAALALTAYFLAYLKDWGG
jgi:hypothetical protein